MLSETDPFPTDTIIVLINVPVIINAPFLFSKIMFNPIALRMAKTPESFGRSKCNRVYFMEFWPF